ncbi:unnamed protein product [Notodromas monacha]|uniref:Uncharacterized protein n=1 Tax=Notodromas monacha TaxID=399045 RepID=A0A7R9GHQ7_9CRUS|nr:unnamed protein product [Notodromas monacha]CAG0921048.1 unnamed protein product [Notodromas monacha]
MTTKCCDEENKSLWAFWYFWLGFAGAVIMLLTLLICASLLWYKKHHSSSTRELARRNVPCETIIRIQNLRIPINSHHRHGDNINNSSDVTQNVCEQGYITTRTERPGGIIRPSVQGKFEWYPTEKQTKGTGTSSAKTLRGMSPLSPAYPPINPMQLTRVPATEVCTHRRYNDDYTEIVLPPGYIITQEKPRMIPEE